MSEPSNTESAPTGPGSRGRGRGRGKSRGGLGKYLRARGRGRGLGRPAEFGKRLVLEGEGPGPEEDEDDEEAAEEAAERARKFSRRQLGSNADRYVEPEPELNSDGEPEPEPEVDLSTFLERQRISEDAGSSALVPPKDEAEEIDLTLSHISSHRPRDALSKKGRVEQIAWDDQLNEMSREKAAAEATWDLKTRFRAKAERLREKPNAPVGRDRKQDTSHVDAPPLPLLDGSEPQPKDPKAEMQDFLDDLLA